MWSYKAMCLQTWIDEGKNLYAQLPYLRAYMGHEDFRDTLYYVHILPERILMSNAIDWTQIESVGLEDIRNKNVFICDDLRSDCFFLWLWILAYN